MSTLQNAFGLSTTLGSRYSLCAGGGSSAAADDATLYASITVGGGVSDGTYGVNVNGQTTLYTVSGGHASPNPLAIWGATASYGCCTTTYIRNFPITGDGVLDATEWTVTYTAQQDLSPNCPVQEVQHYTTTVNVLLGTPPTSAASTTESDGKIGGNQCPSRKPDPMARYSVHSMLVSLNIEDRPLRYTPARGPAIDFTVTYNQKESQQPATFNYSNLGPKWTFNWLSYVSDDPNSQLPLTGVYVSGGGAETFAFDPGSQAFRPDAQSHATLVKTGASSYERRLPDGSKQIFSLSDGATSYPRRIFMTQLVDPAGNAVVIGYDTTFRVTTLTDALSQVTHLYYELSGDALRITKVQDPFLRFATFQYVNGKLDTITDEIGIQSHFTYLSGTDSIDSLTTPYGTTTFVSGQNGTNRWIEMTDPLGGKERVEYRDQAPGISASDPIAPNAVGISNTGLDLANTFYWDKKATQVAPGDYTKAKITHWLYNTDGSISGIASSEKQPLENRVWYTYLGQPDPQHAAPTANPSQVVRVLADGATQLSSFEYNSIGKTTKMTDPVARVMSYIYDTNNNIDLLEIRQTRGTNNELLRKLIYNGQHEPLTDKDAAGQVTTYTYNAFGQVLTRKNAKNETTTYAYGGAVPDGYLASITSPPLNGVSAVTSFGYDDLKRVQTVKNETDQYTVTTDYDNLDRKITVTYPDTTYEQFQYTDNITGAMKLDLTGSRDRLGHWTYRHYNANEQMDSFKDPANRTTTFGWCSCGALTSITDPNDHTTTFNRDLQSRVYQKVFADNTTIDYLFEGQTSVNTPGASSRLKSVTDARHNRTNYSYFGDNNLNQISYTDTSGNPLSPPTPSVSYTYDPSYNRIATMVDGTGLTSYTYYSIASPPALGAGKLQSVDGPLANDAIAFAYDELGRTVGQSINSVAQTAAYDSLGRLTTTENALGEFTRIYDGVTPRLQTLNYPNGQIVNYSYFGNNEDRRLQALENVPNNEYTYLSKFDYTYDAVGQIKSWSKVLGAETSVLWFDYDNADQLRKARDASDETSATQQLEYIYDDAGNRTSSQNHNPNDSEGGLGGTFTSYAVNSLNQTVSAATVDDGGYATLNPAFTYDGAGNLIGDGVGKNFEWDAANRLTAINYFLPFALRGHYYARTEFSYDGLSRRVKIVEKTGSTVTSTKRFVWIGTHIAEERNASNAVTRRYFEEGEIPYGIVWGGNYYYTRDHLGSIREVTDGLGDVLARYDYDPYGQRTKIGGYLDVDFGYTGHYFHAPSGLNLTLHRAYDPSLGKWISRDPIGEDGGLNLYGYVKNNPINVWDPLGLFDVVFSPGTSGHTRGLVNRGVAKLDTTAFGQFLRSLPGTVTFGDSTNQEAPQTDPENGTIYIDATEPLGIGRFSEINDYPEELPPTSSECGADSTDAFLAVIIGHEIGHSLFRQLTEPAIVRTIENRIRIQLNIVPRTHYHGIKLP